MARGNLTKAAIVEEVARASNLTRSRAEVVVRAVFGSMVKAMRRGEEIELRGFGSFRLRRRESRTGRNPKTGGHVDVPPKRIPYFKPGSELMERINRESALVETLPLSG